MNVISRGYIRMTKYPERRGDGLYIYDGYISRVKVFTDTITSCDITIEKRKLTDVEIQILKDYPMVQKNDKYTYYLNYNSIEHLIEESNVKKITLTFFDGFDCDILTIDEYIDDLFDSFCCENNRMCIRSKNILTSKEFGLKKGITNFLDYAKYIQPIIKKMIIKFLRDKSTICNGLQKSFQDRFLETLANIFVIKYIKPLFKENEEQKECTHVKMRKKIS